MIIRNAEKSDIDMLVDYDKHISKKELENSIMLKRVYIAEENGDFIGWMRFNLFWDNTPFMNMLYILENYQNKGYGRQLVGYWENEMKNTGYDIVMTSTVAEEYAQHFYNKLGYKAAGGFMLPDDLYEIILAKKL